MLLPRVGVLCLVVTMPAIACAQPAPSADYTPPVGLEVSQFRSIQTTVSEGAGISTIVTTVDQSMKPVDPLPAAATPAPNAPCPPPDHHLMWPEVWGLIDVPAYVRGNRMAPNGVPFKPLFGLNIDFNVGLLPHKELYLFAENEFWTQKAAPGITNPSQGQFDFSKREYDLNLGLAWNYWNSLELRAFAYAQNNLNRGVSLASPYGYQDGVGIENRYYFGYADIYDLGRLSFVSIGYYPSKSMVTGDGLGFKPGVFARAYVTYDIPVILSYA